MLGKRFVTELQAPTRALYLNSDEGHVRPRLALSMSTCHKKQVWVRSWGPRKRPSKQGFRNQIIFLPSVLIFSLGQSMDYVSQVSTLGWIIGREKSIKALPAPRWELLLTENTQRLVTGPKWDAILSREPSSHACRTGICSGSEGRFLGSWWLCLHTVGCCVQQAENDLLSLHTVWGRGGAGAGPAWTTAFWPNALVARLFSVGCIHMSKHQKWLNYSKQASNSMI